MILMGGNVDERNPEDVLCDMASTTIINGKH